MGPVVWGKRWHSNLKNTTFLNYREKFFFPELAQNVKLAVGISYGAVCVDRTDAACTWDFIVVRSRRPMTFDFPVRRVKAVTRHIAPLLRCSLLYGCADCQVLMWTHCTTSSGGVFCQQPFGLKNPLTCFLKLLCNFHFLLQQVGDVFLNGTFLKKTVIITVVGSLFSILIFFVCPLRHQWRPSRN